MPSPIDPQPLLEILARRYPTAKRQTLRRMLQGGGVTLNGKRAMDAKQLVAPADELVVRDVAQPESVSRKPGSQVDVIYEDADILVAAKPVGLLTSTVPNERRPTLLAMVRAHVAARDPKAQLGLIHRLDRDASGLLIFSKNDAAYQSLKSQFFHHTVTREYMTVVHGVPSAPEGRIESFLVERADGSVHSTRQVGKGQRAETRYAVVAHAGRVSLLRVTLQTGRKHQIRVHLRERGTPIVGDRVYGPPATPGTRLMLAATRLTIAHPRTGREMTFTVPLPKEFPIQGDESAAASKPSPSAKQRR